MPEVPKSFSFRSRVERLETAGPVNHVIPVPDDVSQSLDEQGVKRVIASLNGHESRRALQGPRSGGRYLVAGQSLLKGIGWRNGDEIEVVLVPDPEPDRVDIPEELRLALEQDERARQRWETFTKGRQRSLCIYVTEAKQEATRIRRALELAEKIRTHTLYGDVRR